MPDRYRIGIDIGGTFTDFILMDEASSDLEILKVSSTPAMPTSAVIEGVRVLAEREGISPSAITYFVHGTTLALNTVIQRSGARTGLLVTAGFGDILELQRLRMPDPYNLLAEKPRSLVQRRHVREIKERLYASGRVREPLDAAEVSRAADELVAAGVEALAICFLHAYRNAEHERHAASLVRERHPTLYTCASSEVWPQQREYERALITVINAHVGERMRRYFEALQTDLRRIGVAAPIFSTKSNGGIMSARSAAAAPVQTLLSGPASGVIGAQHICRAIGQTQFICLDMGGTSADVAVVAGEIPFSSESKVGDFPLLMPTVAISSIGAGGGSIAWTDRSGLLKVGPHSAGAQPGPACYGRGGTQATVTDAYLTAGIVNPDYFLGGTMQLDAEAGQRAVGELGARLALGPVETANAILEVATARMYAQFVPLLTRYGVDPREFAILAYGGAGPTHAFMLAEEVGIRRVIVPPMPGALCALGSLVADVRSDFVRTVYARADAVRAADLEAAFTELEREALAWLGAQDVGDLPTALLRSAEMRYLGQSSEINVPLPTRLAHASMPEVLARFHRQYEQTYRYADPAAPVEIIDLRVMVTGTTPKPQPGYRPPTGRREAPVNATRTVRLRGHAWRAAVYRRADLQVGDRFAGPALVEQYDTTVFVTPGFEVHVDAFGNLIGEAVIDG